MWGRERKLGGQTITLTNDNSNFVARMRDAARLRSVLAQLVLQWREEKRRREDGGGNGSEAVWHGEDSE